VSSFVIANLMIVLQYCNAAAIIIADMQYIAAKRSRYLAKNALFVLE
jgi:hypothetical protein